MNIRKSNLFRCFSIGLISSLSSWASFLFFLLINLSIGHENPLFSQPNNNYNPDNKTTKTVVGLRQSNCWKPLPTTSTTHSQPNTNSKLYDEADIDNNLKTKVISLNEEVQNSFWTPSKVEKNISLGPKKNQKETKY